MQALDSFCRWLALTTVSQTLQTTEWIIPALQTVHILSVAAAITSALMVNLRLLGVGRRGQPMAAVAERFLPSIWWPLPLLFLTGSVLIIAEPARALENPVFWFKMSLLAAVATMTWIGQSTLRRQADFWTRADKGQWPAKAAAILSLAMWVAIVFSGRWIAYVQVG
ncbi:MAG: hypothetical protein M3O06_11555 [Pseudomonadota bacterium]|nr:hypothetical protein [Pseudomonadota bacterium]